MSDPRHSPDVWDAIFNQTPIVLRWALGALIAFIISLVAMFYRWHREDLREMHDKQQYDSEQTNHRIDRLESKMDQSLSTMNGHLIEIAQNTRRLPKRHDDHDE